MHAGGGLDASSSDRAFVDAAIARGLIGPAQAAEAIEHAHAQPPPVDAFTVGRSLVAKGFLRPVDLVALCLEARHELYVCGGCAARLGASQVQPLMACPSCGAILEASRVDISREVSAAEVLGSRQATDLSIPLPLRGHPTPTSSGDVLARYRVDGELGRGGVGVVLRTHDTQLDRPVALKIVRPGPNVSPRTIERFLREGRAAARLSHPGIVAVYEVGQVKDFFYLAQKLVDGRPLIDLIAGPEGPPKVGDGLGVTEGVDIVYQALDAIGAAHAAGLIHRDLKPHNIIVDDDGRAHLIDFGLARDTEQTGGNTLTQQGQLLGTPWYMSPEQFTSPHAVDLRADLYALGAVLYQCLTGSPPYTGASIMDLMADVLAGDLVRASVLAPDLPPALDEAIARALARDPDERFPSATEFAKALASAVDDELPTILLGPGSSARHRMMSPSSARHRAMGSSGRMKAQRASSKRHKAPPSSGRTKAQPPPSSRHDVPAAGKGSGAEIRAAGSTGRHRQSSKSQRAPRQVSSRRQRAQVSTRHPAPRRSAGGALPVSIALAVAIVLVGIAAWVAGRSTVSAPGPTVAERPAVTDPLPAIDPFAAAPGPFDGFDDDDEHRFDDGDDDDAPPGDASSSLPSNDESAADATPTPPPAPAADANANVLRALSLIVASFDRLVAGERSARADIEEARAALEEAVGRTSDADADAAAIHALLGCTALALDDVDAAIAALDRSAELAPYDAVALRLLAVVLLRGRRSERALEVLGTPSLLASGDALVPALTGLAHIQRGDLLKANQVLGPFARARPADADLLGEPITVRFGGPSGELAASIEIRFRHASSEAGRLDATLFDAVRQLARGDADRAAALAERAANEHGASARPHTLLGLAALRRSDASAAQRHLERASELAPEDPAVVICLAILESGSGRAEAANARLERLLESETGRNDALLTLAMLAAQTGRRDDARRWAERAWMNTTAVQERLRLIVLFREIGDPLRAATASAELSAQHPDNPMVLEAAGQAALASGDPDRALDSFRKLAARFEHVARVHTLMADALAAKGDAEGARTSLRRAIEIAPDDLGALVGLASIAGKQGKLDEVRRMALRIRRHHPRSAKSDLLEGQAALAERKLGEAGAAFEKAFAKEPSREIALRAASTFAEARDFAGGSRVLRAWLAGNPKDAAVRSQLALLLQTAGRRDEAKREYRRVAELEPGNAGALNNLAWMMFEDGESGARGFAERAYQANPRSWQVADTLGWILVHQGEAERAVTILAEAVEHADGNPSARHHYAAALAKAGRGGEARKVARAILDEQPDYEHADAVRELLRKLR